jgi:hypothetical protein
MLPDGFWAIALRWDREIGGDTPAAALATFRALLSDTVALCCH